MRQTLVFKMAFILALCLPGTVYSCAMFVARDQGQVIVGNNEDAANPYTRVWFVPPENGRYGGIYFGWDERWPQGGMNDQGLVFDILGTPFLEITRDDDKPVSPDEFLTRKVMAEAATVEEALAIIDRYSLTGMETGQMMYADRSGDAAIVEGDITHRIGGPHLVATNFYLSQVSEKTGVTCPRYRIADELLDTLPPSVETFRTILKGIHFEGNWGGTQYSNIYLPAQGRIHLYHFHNFEEVVVFDLREELAKGYRNLAIADLFPRNFAFETYLEAQPETVADVLEDTFDKAGIEATIELARKMQQGWQELEPVFARYFSAQPVSIADHENEWNPAMVAGRHKTRELRIGPEHLKDLARAVETRGQHGAAIQLLQANIELHPGYLPNHYWLGVIYRDNGQPSLAAEQFLQADELSPDNPWVKEARRQLEQVQEEAEAGEEEG